MHCLEERRRSVITGMIRPQKRGLGRSDNDLQITEASCGGGWATAVRGRSGRQGQNQRAAAAGMGCPTWGAALCWRPGGHLRVTQRWALHQSGLIGGPCRLDCRLAASSLFVCRGCLRSGLFFGPR